MFKTSEIKAYKNNPRNNDDAVGPVAESIKQFGFKVPIIIDKNNVVVAGHTRLKAAIKLKLTEVPCIVADDLTEEQIKAFRLADNKVSEFATWDFELLDIELVNISCIDMSDFGFLNVDILDDELERLKNLNNPTVKFDTVDSSSVCSGSRFGTSYYLKNGCIYSKKLKRSGKRIKDLKIIDDHNMEIWCTFQKIKGGLYEK